MLQNKILISILISSFLAYMFTPFVIKLAKKFGLIDDPKKNKHPKVIHTYPVPRGGGLAIFGAVVITSFLTLPIDKHLVGILSGALIIIILGLLDDKYNLSPYTRLPIQFLAASMPIIAGIGIAYISNPLGGIIDLSHPQINFAFLGETRSIWILSDLFALFWIVMLMNFMNMGASGIDGQVTGTTVVASIAIGILSLRFSADITQWPVTILASITAGAYLGFLPWHTYPQKIMPSFGGATLSGYLLGVLSILTTAKVGALMVILAVPLVDTGYVIVKRVASGKAPFWGDRGHLHHRLLDSGWSKKSVSYFYWLVTGLLGFLAINLNAQHKFYTMIGVSAVLGGMVIWLTHKKPS